RHSKPSPVARRRSRETSERNGNPSRLVANRERSPRAARSRRQDRVDADERSVRGGGPSKQWPRERARGGAQGRGKNDSQSRERTGRDRVHGQGTARASGGPHRRADESPHLGETGTGEDGSPAGRS